MTFTLPSGYTLTLTADGWSKATKDGGIVAEGPLQLLNGAWFFDKTIPFNQPYIPPITASSLADGSVRHLYTGALTALVDYAYTVEGNDLLVQATVTNHGAMPLQPAFRSPRLLVADWEASKATASVGLGFDQSHTRNVGAALSYPSASIPTAAAYVRTATTSGAPINVCTWSREDPRDQHMTIGVGVPPGLPGRSLLTCFFSSVPPGGTRVYRWAYRFCACNDIPTLLGGYKAHVRAARPVAYQIDRRPVAQFVHLNTAYIRPDNPYGYADNGTNITRRFDKPEGVADYVAQLVPKMQQAGCQGLIAWQLQGIHPRGVIYRPDFDVFPPETLANLPALVQGFTAANLTIGLLARPSVVITSSSTWAADMMARQSVEASGLAEIRARVQWAKAKGFKGFYLDSFIGDAADHQILSAMRAEAGPAAGFFTEYSTALSLADSGGYLQLSYQNGQYVYPLAFRDRRELYPETVWLTKFTGALPPGGYAALFDYMQAEHFTPLIEDWLLMNNIDNIPALLGARSWT